LRALRDAVEHVHFEPALDAEQGRQQPDGSCAGNEQDARTPSAGAMADALGLIPGFGENARWLEQNPEQPERRIDLDGELRLEPISLRAIAVALLDAALGVAAVAAHIPFADRACGTRNRIRTAYDADDEVAADEARPVRRLLDDAERLVAEHEPALAGRSPAVFSRYDFAVGTAYAERAGANPQGTLGG